MKTKILVVMGVSGAGKTTVGRRVAQSLQWSFYDGDDFHPPANIAKMSRGEALTDEDRAGWLGTLADLLAAQARKAEGTVLACSALKAAYRQRLRVDPAVSFAYLRGTYDQILQRLIQRAGHFMGPELLASQFATLEEPTDCLTLDIERPIKDLVQQIVGWVNSPRTLSPTENQ